MSKSFSTRSFITFILAFMVAAAILGACGGGSKAPTAAPAAPAGPNANAAVAPEAKVDEPAAAAVAPPEPLPLPWAPAPVIKERAAAPPAVSALGAIVVDEASNAVLFDKDAHLPLPPASLTKIATLILALEHGNLDAWVESDVDSRLMRGSSVMGLLPGDGFTLNDLLYGMILPSGNDAALAIARAVAGSDEAFVAQMNALVARLGLSESHFVNPHGLGGTGHVASAYDLAELSRYGMSIPGFREVVTAPYWVLRGSRTLALDNINTFLTSYRGADGIKTGFTRGAGPTLAASATRDGHRLYAVVLNDPDRSGDASRLLTWAFANYSWAQ